MQEFDHIEALWAAHTVDVKITSDEMLKQAKKEVNNIRTKSILTIVVMALSLVGVACVWLLEFDSWTTHVGISIIVLAIAVFTGILYNNYRIIAKNDFTVNPTEFISQLKIYQLKRQNLYNRLYWFYAVALSLGMVLYFFELSAYLTPWVQVVTVGLSFGWMIFCSTLVRKAVIKKDKQRIALLIEKFERISGQFQEQK
ncbi:MAG: hypothetical protein ACQUHE_10140 [Bacteroidia bacterium]